MAPRPPRSPMRAPASSSGNICCEDLFTGLSEPAEKVRDALQEATMGMATQGSNLISSENVEGTAVYDPSGNKIGQIDHLMIDKVSGVIRYAIMSFGGFLGIGEGEYPLPWKAFKYDTNLGGYVTNVTAEQLKNAPEFDETSWSNRDWETRLHRHFGSAPYWEEGMGAQGRGTDQTAGF
jgi:hypothetical protein